MKSADSLSIVKPRAAAAPWKRQWIRICTRAAGWSSFAVDHGDLKPRGDWASALGTRLGGVAWAAGTMAEVVVSVALLWATQPDPREALSAPWCTEQEVGKQEQEVRGSTRHSGEGWHMGWHHKLTLPRPWCSGARPPSHHRPGRSRGTLRLRLTAGRGPVCHGLAHGRLVSGPRCRACCTFSGCWPGSFPHYCPAPVCSGPGHTRHGMDSTQLCRTWEEWLPAVAAWCRVGVPASSGLC